MECVYLIGGLTVPLEALQLIWELEFREFAFRVDGDSMYITPPRDKNGTERDKLTENEYTKIVKWKMHLISLISYGCA